jgi:gamma-glutamyl-gamma-aminobutyrate hydrolase PuuD
MSKLKILLYADSDLYKNRVGQSVPYVEFFSNFGEVILVQSSNDLEFFADISDVLALPGGADVDATKYGKIPLISNGRANIQYETLDSKLLPKFLESGKPVIGICRGAQAINVALGGTLHQHILGHNQIKDRQITTDVMFTNDEDKHKMVEINSFHHQAVEILADGLEVLGWSAAYKFCPSLRKENELLYVNFHRDLKTGKIQINKQTQKAKRYYSVIEAFQSSANAGHNVLAFQYHPEEYSCPYAFEKIDELLQNCYPEYNPENQLIERA